MTKETTCTWTYSNDEDDYWMTSCSDNLYQFNDGGPKDNKFKFCPYCGKRLKEKKP